MTNAIGLRCYKITARKEREAGCLDFDDPEVFSLPPSLFIQNFVATHNSSVRDGELERSWYFEERGNGPSTGSTRGYIHYGTYGFESDLIDSSTSKKQYRRKVNDVEEIPLFYEFWRPPNADYAFASFQSFAGRSCVRIILSRMQELFRVANARGVFDIRKLVPLDESSNLFRNAQVKQVRFLKRNAPSDLADRYSGGNTTSIDMELALKAKRQEYFGKLGNLVAAIRRDRTAGLVEYGGIQFDEAIANIKVGGRYRPVSILGVTSDAGVIDITDQVEKGINGHPLFESVETQSKEILSDFNRTIAGLKR